MSLVGVAAVYFRAPGVGAVLAGVADRARFPDFDGVEAEWFGFDAAMDRLVALARGVDEHVIVERQVWPAGPDPEGPVAAGDPWLTGPFVSEWDVATRDALAALASVSDEDVARVAVAWARGEGLEPVAEVVPWVVSLVRVARAARDAGESLFCSVV
ncbi:hypothetical protein [Actinokineospora globicatena]|uniref:hypothetical protein n=1 Tax=Actinokineospora globicatena TaxID=103729 RepID=UPI002552AA87|nr:hypothetical protein [Actinokineospora globicatena]